MTTERNEATAGLDDALGGLPREIAPARDLWPAIEARLEPRGGRAAGRWLWPAAAAVVLVAGSSLLTAHLVRREDATAARPAPAGGDVTYAAATFGPGRTFDPAYDAARAELARSLAARVARLPPDVRRQLEQNLAELRRARTAVNAALALNPGDPLLEELLLNAYQDELAVLASVNQLTGGNGAAPTAGRATDPARMHL